MATRVLNTIRERDRIKGFRLICSLKNHFGIHVINMTEAITFYKTIEKFENVKLNEKGQWEGLECSLDRLPYMDKAGNWIKCKERWSILGRIYEEDNLVGYKLMDLMGNVFYYDVDETILLAQNEGLINGKLVTESQGFTISAIRGRFKKFPVSDRCPQLRKGVMGNKMSSEEKNKRYEVLAKLFGQKQEGKITDLDIAKVVGANSAQEYSKKIHEYLGEDLGISDKDILQKLYHVYMTLKKENNTVNEPSKVNTAPVKREELKVDDFNPDIKKMRELIAELTKAAEVYYSGEDEIMSNYEYDAKYDELAALEKKTGTVLQGSLTQKVGFEVKSKLQKVKHEYKALSLDKTKDREELANSLGGQPGFLSWKLDGLTIVLTYENGELIRAVTRGDGVTGEDVTHNAKFFAGVPLKIGYTDKLVIRGEALISYKDFEKINATITNVDDKYKNPRNLASGSVRQLDSKIAKDRHVRVVAFTVVEGFDDLENYTDKLNELKKFGFEVVEFVKVTKDTTVAAIGEFEKRVEKLPYPTDGLVITIDNIAYGEMLGMTAKFPRNAKAFKWADEDTESTLIDIEWSVGRTGAITPVAIFKPIDIDGSTVQRASVHNLSVLRDILGEHPSVGQSVSVIKSNMIIPQIVKSDKGFKGKEILVPTVCPVCGCQTSRIKSNDAEVLMCTNSNCTARHLEGLSHFVSRDCMNIDGLSDATLEVFVNEGFVRTFKDIYHLNEHENEIINLDGFGKGSYNKLWKAIEKSRECELPAFIGSLGIPQMGKGTSKDVCKALDYDLDRLVDMDVNELQGIAGVGGKTAQSIVDYFAENKDMVLDLAKEMHFKAMPKVDRNSPIANMVFCITGDVYTFKNRKELQAKIESLGAKATGSVSAKTNYLINNDITSTSNKNQTAKKLGVPIISEADFLKMIGE